MPRTDLPPNDIRITTLPNGIRIVTDTVRFFQSVALEIWVGVGSRFETPAQSGYSHLLEHMVFKGTPTRASGQIDKQMAAVGGRIGAATDASRTAYYTKVLKSDLPMALDIMSDMIQHASLLPDELEKEKGAILEEINGDMDSAACLSAQLFESCAYPNQPLGNPAIGSAESVRSVTARDLHQYMQTHYTGPQIIISAAGNVSHDAFVAKCADLFRDCPAKPHDKLAPAKYAGGDVRQNNNLKQLRLRLGFPAPPCTDDDYCAAALLSQILREGLFDEIREKRGLFYSISAAVSARPDTNMLRVSTNAGAENIKELMPVLCDEIARMQGSITEAEIALRKRQMGTGLLMGQESVANRANELAGDMLTHGRVIPIAERLEKLEAVTAADLARVARRIFSGKPTLAAFGPIQHLMEYDELCRRLNTKKELNPALTRRGGLSR